MVITPDIPEDSPKGISSDYYTMLGKMVSLSTNSELLVKSVFVAISGLSQTEANILMDKGRLKVTDMPSIIKGFLEHKPFPDSSRNKDLVHALDIFSKLYEERNKFVHWLWINGGDELHLFNVKPRAKPRELSNEEKRPVPVERLQEICTHMSVVYAMLADYIPSNEDLETREKAPRQDFARWAEDT